MSAPIDARVLLVGAGGLGSPAGIALARAGVRHLTVLDDDSVDETNLHRQILYDDGDVGEPKVTRAAARLRAEARAAGFDCEVEARAGRLVPEEALAHVAGHDLVLEGADNFATKFLASDACRLAGVPLVQAGAVRWTGWAFASVSTSACLRCVFEDMPRGREETCAAAGVIGPVVGVLGALEAALALRLLLGERDAAGVLHHLRGLDGSLRRRRIRRRSGCPGCEGAIADLAPERYQAPYDPGAPAREAPLAGASDPSPGAEPT